VPYPEPALSEVEVEAFSGRPSPLRKSRAARELAADKNQTAEAPRTQRNRGAPAP